MKLLNRTLKSYLVYSFLLLLVTVPLFYFVVRNVLLHAVDKSLKTQLGEIRNNLKANISTPDLEVWSELDKDIHLEKSDKYFEDYIHTRYLKTHENDKDLDPFRQIEASLKVNGQYYKLTISTSLVENEDLLASIVLVEALLLIALMLGMLWINRNISKKLWSPFYETLSKIQEYEFNKHGAIRLKETSTTEFTDLNRSLENLLNKNYNTYLAQKEFTENASHEMQTPLAIFQSQLELLMQTAPLSEEQAGLINSMETNNKRLAKLNRSLLLLAKIENEEYQPTELVPIADLVKKFLPSFQYYFQKKDLKVIENYYDNITLQANKTLLEILISNLISNAVRHNIQGGKIWIDIRGGNLTIKNTGNSERLETGRIYERFYKQGSEKDGIGLGLAIVQRICNINHFAIQYFHSDGMHEFKINFLPAA